VARHPRRNELLDATSIGATQVAAGGMHGIALTHDQKILTWGVNDAGALGRDTTWQDAPTRDADDDDDDDEDEDMLNPKESTPTAIPTEHFGTGLAGFAQVVATDSAAFALTLDGLVYGWGTFSVSPCRSRHAWCRRR
jgi:regulator of chromosome condensation